MSGVVEGVAEEQARVRREEQPDRCCGVISSAGSEHLGGRGRAER